jgi:hypothetical protein
MRLTGRFDEWQLGRSDPRRKTMKKILLLAVLALALPTAMFGSSIDYTNSGGTLSGSSAGLSLSGSVLISVNGLNAGGLLTGSNLQLTVNTGKGFINGSTRISSGETSGSATVPEPGSLTLLGSGLLVLAGLVRRKMNS